MAEPLVNEFGVKPILGVLGLSVASHYRRRRGGSQKRSKRVIRPSRSLEDLERERVLAVLHEPRFVDRAPAEVVATLLDEETYLCSERTMYRILEDNDEVRERRNQLRHPKYAKPELIATAPNEVWSWDITKLRTLTKWTYLYLYVILDVFSRYVVGWMLAEHENAQLARQLIEETYDRQGITPGQVTLHSDRGSPMKSKTLAQLLADLDVTRSLSRPHVSDDNPFSESQFKTLKYHPVFPGKFAGMLDGLEYCREFFPWYNQVHRHSGIAYLTPEDVHLGRAQDVLSRRQRVMDEAFQAHPDRFPRGVPRVAQLPEAVWINPPKPTPEPEPVAPQPSAAGEVEVRATNRQGQPFGAIPPNSQGTAMPSGTSSAIATTVPSGATEEVLL